MKLTALRIENFRSFKDETINFDDYTCLVGPNGAGKSAVLTALNVFFRHTTASTTNLHSLTKEDFHHQNTSDPIKITLTFEGLPEEAQQDFKHYYRQGRLTIFAKAIWDENTKSADVKQFGARLVMKRFAPYFEADDNKAKASELKKIYEKIREELPSLPDSGTKQEMTDALRTYEENHPQECELLDDSAQFYGWSKGVNLLRRYVQWVFVPAVKDASTEQEESSRTALGELLERTIRTRVNFAEPIAQLKNKLEEGYRSIIEKEQVALSDLQISLEKRLRSWANPGASVNLNWHYDEDVPRIVEG